MKRRDVLMLGGAAALTAVGLTGASSNAEQDDELVPVSTEWIDMEPPYEVLVVHTTLNGEPWRTSTYHLEAAGDEYRLVSKGAAIA